MATLSRSSTAVSQQWATRPSDERFTSIADLYHATKAWRDASIVGRAQWSDIHVTADGVGDTLLIKGNSGLPVTPSNWAFSQVCARAGAPAAYLGTLPATIAATALEASLKGRTGGSDSARLLLRKNDSGVPTQLVAATSGQYARIWNCEIAERLMALQSEQPEWQFPEAFRSASGDAHGVPTGEQLPTAFASDRDLFVFLVDYERPVEIGETTLFRGFYVENSEVGAAKFRLTSFLFDFVCCNLMIWGQRNVTEIGIRHVGSARDRAFGGMHVEVKRFANESSSNQRAQIVSAQRYLVAETKEKVLDKLFGLKSLGLTRSILTSAYETAERTPRYGDPRSAWGVANGLTEVSQGQAHASARLDIDKAAGRIIEMAF